MPFLRFSSILFFSFLVLTRPVYSQHPGLSVSHPKTIEQYDKLISDLRYKDPDSALDFANKGLLLAKSKHDENGTARMLNQIGMIQDNMGRHDDSRKNYLEAMRLYRKTGNQKGIASEVIRLGVVELRKGNFDKSTGFFLNALKISELSKNEPGQMEAYCTLAEASIGRGKYDTAVVYLDTAQTFSDRLPFWSISLNVYNNYGVAYRELGKLEKAAYYLKKGISMSGQPKYQGLFITLNNTLASVYSRQGERKKAVKLLENSLSTARRIHNYLRELQTLMTLAETFQTSDPKMAISYDEQALKLAANKKAYKQQVQILGDLSALYKKQGNFKDALIAKEKQNSISDSIFYKAMSKQITSLQSQYELYKSRGNVQKLQYTNARQLLRFNIMLSIAGAVVIILFFLSYFTYRTKHLNGLLNNANLELKESNTVKDKLFSVIAHDLRSPLASVIGLLYLLEDDSLEESKRNEFITKLAETCNASLETLNNLLRWGEMQMKGVRLNIMPFDPSLIIKRNIMLLSGSADEKNISVKNASNDSILVMADPDHFDFIIRNLLSNAIKFTPPGGEVTVISVKNKGHIIFTVKDTGIGIEKHRLTGIFNMSNVSTNGTNNERGTSLGLFMSKEFVEANQGKISVDSVPGAGSEFKFTLPKA